MTTPPPAPPTGTRWTNVFLVALFTALLWLPTLEAWFHFDHTPDFNEKRLPATWPRFNSGGDGLKQYAAGLEAYFNDHFGYRKQLIRWHLEWQLKIFHVGRTDVMLGKDGWLFFDEPGTHLVENFQGHRSFSPQELAGLQRLHESRRDWLAQRGIQYLFVVAPDKSSIYPEYLPFWLKPAHPHTQLDQFLDYMREHSTVTVLDLRPALREAKRIAPTYYKTDSHWNFFGGFVASGELVKALTPKAGLEPLSLDSFELKKTPLERGDLATMLGVYARDDDWELAPKTNLPPLVKTLENSQFLKSAYFTDNASAHGVCMVFHDSFGPALRPFLGYHFKTTGYFWGPGGFDTNRILSFKPDVVISELVERHLGVAAGENRDHP